jgi:hypothetical protein
MGTMSASDAAPLPRLGEVFFDVRGNSRSMRLSWYADTGVAVLSIWQGGMCTGTFRLAIADLPRMVETLQRGPGGQQPGWDGQAPGQAFADAPVDATSQVRAMGPMSGQMMQPGPGDYPGGVPEYQGPGPAGYPGEPQQDRRGQAPDYVADPVEALGRLGVPEAGGPPSAPYQTGAREYVAAAPSGERPAPADYLTAPPPDHRPDPADYLTGPPPGQRPAPTDYLTGPPPGQRPDPADYLTGPPPGQRPDPADYLTGPPPAAERGYGGDFQPGGAAAASYPGAGDSGAYPQDTGRQAAYPSEPPSDPYLVATGAMDYQGEPPVSHYPGGSPAPRSARRAASRSSAQDDALGPTTADYPVHYGAAVTDEMGDEPPVESFPYQPRRGSR